MPTALRTQRKPGEHSAPESHAFPLNARIFGFLLRAARAFEAKFCKKSTQLSQQKLHAISSDGTAHAAQPWRMFCADFACFSWHTPLKRARFCMRIACGARGFGVKICTKHARVSTQKTVARHRRRRCCTRGANSQSFPRQNRMLSR